MPKASLPRIAAVEAGWRPLTLRVTWAGDGESLVDVSGIVANFRVYAPLRDSDDLLRAVRLSDRGTDVVWSDDIDMSADTLWRRAQEQSGATLSAAEFKR